jgi:cytochrome c peroxidase
VTLTPVIWALVFCGAVVLAADLEELPLPPPVSDADYPPRDPAVEELGRLLFFDKILSGNRNISCATCHHPMAATGDGLSLPCGEGGRGLGVTRDTGIGIDVIHERVPRNAPHIYNLGAYEFTRMFHDGRLETMPSHPSGFFSPAGDDLPSGLTTPLAAQAMFPVTSGAEMAGQAGENAVANAAAVEDLPTVWMLLAHRLRAIPAYVDLFIDAFPDVSEAADITFVHAANAIGAFEATAGRADQSPFDRWLRGDTGAMSPRQLHGMSLFYGEMGCADCHSGPFQTDHEFYSIGIPQVGPGKGDDPPDKRTGGRHDFGRERVTGIRTDRMKFRTPTLRNVAITGPWGHDGAYDDLELMVRHHFRPRWHLQNYDPEQMAVPSRGDLDAVDLIVMNDPPSVGLINSCIELPGRSVGDHEIDLIMEFLHALTDPRSLDSRHLVPAEVPSGLPVFD